MKETRELVQYSNLKFRRGNDIVIVKMKPVMVQMILYYIYIYKGLWRKFTHSNSCCTIMKTSCQTLSNNVKKSVLSNAGEAVTGGPLGWLAGCPTNLVRKLGSKIH